MATRTQFQKRSDGLLWAGRIEGDRLSSVLFVVRNGRLTGHLNTTGGDFVIQSVAGPSTGASARSGDDMIAIGQPEPVHGAWCGARPAPAGLLSSGPRAAQEQEAVWKAGWQQRRRTTRAST